MLSQGVENGCCMLYLKERAKSIYHIDSLVDNSSHRWPECNEHVEVIITRM